MSTLLVPELTPGRGSGHLRRALRILDQLPDAVVLIPSGTEHAASLTAAVPPERTVSTPAPAYDRVIIDQFHARESEILEHMKRGLTIGVDLGGPGRARCEYLVDTLPRLSGEPANLTDPSLLTSDTGPGPAAEPGHAVPVAASPGTADSPRATASAGGPGTILVSFGGEDPAQLTEAAVAILDAAGYGSRTVVVAPSMRSLEIGTTGARILPPQPTLSPLLARARWVITSFGMTAYEALAAGAQVLTIAPTRYHDRLAAQAGFVRVGVRRPHGRRLKALLAGERAYRCGARAPERQRSLARFIGELPAPESRGCPAHPHAHGRAVWRNEEKSYFVCPVCGLRYLERFARDLEDYSPSYFMEEYRAQYGRTYLEDFAHIYRMGERRVKSALALLEPPAETNDRPPALLDVGCAYGPFLAAARDSGFEPYGLDVACEAVGYVRETLEIPALCGDLLQVDPAAAWGRTEFDAVTLWYVIEHFPDLRAVLARIAGLVRPGGLLALSTPHGGGVSARRNPDGFYEVSPRDHYTIWDRRSAKRVLAEFGFRVRRFVITGHHPERYPGVAKGRIPSRLAALHSRLAGRGDTFEIYATRER